MKKADTNSISVQNWHQYHPEIDLENIQYMILCCVNVQDEFIGEIKQENFERKNNKTIQIKLKLQDFKLYPVLHIKSI